LFQRSGQRILEVNRSVKIYSHGLYKRQTGSPVNMVPLISDNTSDFHKSQIYYTRIQRVSPEGATHNFASIPHKSFVVINPVRLQKLSLFLLKTCHSMVLPLDTVCGVGFNWRAPSGRRH
jgi:hypothetical protein